MRNPYRLLDSRVAFENRMLTVYEDRVGLPDSSEGRFAWLEIVPGALLLALNSKREVYLVREYKYGIKSDSLELVGGAIDSGEEPLEAAQRELKEEAGISAGKWTPLGPVDPFTTFINSPNHQFLAEDVYETPHPPHANEVLEVVKLPFDEVVDRVMANQISHAPTCTLVLKVAELLRRRGA